MNLTTENQDRPITFGTETEEYRSLLRGVRRRRAIAFVIDYCVIALMMIPAAIIVFILGIATLGAGWLLFGILGPLVALVYVGLTLGGPSQATWGMQMTDVRLARLDGAKVDWLLAIVHTVLFWAANAILTPLVLAFTLISAQKRTLHDLLLGTVVIRDRYDVS